MDAVSYSVDLIYGKLRWLWGTPACQLSLDPRGIVAAVLLAPATVCKASPHSLTCGCPNIQSWVEKCKEKKNGINLSGQADPSSPHRHRTDITVLMKPFHLEGQENRITSLIPVGFAKLSHFSLFPFGILLSQAKIPRARDIPSSLFAYINASLREFRKITIVLGRAWLAIPFSISVMLMEVHQNIATVFSLWIMDEMVEAGFFFCLSHLCWPFSVDQLPRKVCSCSDLTEEPGPVPRRPDLLMNMAKEGALWRDEALPTVGKDRGDCSPLLPLILEGLPERRCLPSCSREQSENRAEAALRSEHMTQGLQIHSNVCTASTHFGLVCSGAAILDVLAGTLSTSSVGYQAGNHISLQALASTTGWYL